MKKKLILLIIIVLIGGGTTWAIINQINKPTQSQPNSNSETTSKKPSIPGGQTIISKNTPKSNTSDGSNNSENTHQVDQTTTNTNSNHKNSSVSARQDNHSGPRSQQSNSSNSSNSSSQPSTPPTSPSNPNVTPTPPATNPSDPQNPPTNPPDTQTPPTPTPQPETDQQKAARLLNSLKSPTNQNVVQFTNDDNQIRTVIWTKGITGPVLENGGDFRRVEENHGGDQFVTYTTLYRNDFLNSGWYDVDKTTGSSAVDRNLCFGAVASNQLHWWMNYNKDRVQQFLAKTDYVNTLPPANTNTLKDLRLYINSFNGQQDSKIFTMMKTYFGNNSEGYYADPLIDMFINGHKPKPNGGFNDPDWPHNFQMDTRGGFFHDVFSKRNLTRRLSMSTFNEFSNEAKKAFQNGESVGLIHMTSGNYTHIITAWGLEYDLDGKLVGVYVTDSDDQDDILVNGMKRYGVNNVDNKAVLSNNLTNSRAGARINMISTLGLGENKWTEYLE